MPKAPDNPFSLKVELIPEDHAIVVTLRRREGEEYKDVESETFSMSGVAPELHSNIEAYGLSKFLQDRASQVAVGPDKLAEMRDVFGRLSEGEWEKERVVGAPTVSAEIDALSRLKGISIPEAQRALRGYAKDVREKILSHSKVKELAAQIRASRESTPVASLDDLAA